MPPLVMFIASGWIFWTGIGLLLSAVPLAAGSRFRWCRRLTGPVVFLGWLGVLLSATPLFGWFPYLLFSAAAWLAASGFLPRLRRWAAISFFVALVLAAALLEIPYWRDPPPLPAPGRVWILGDSISAGIGWEGEEVWSERLNRRYPGRFVNRATGGATAESSLESLRHYRPAPGDVIFIEIGGNDLLHGASARIFRTRLETLLQAVAATGAPAVMMELPRPPFYSGYGRAQRELAKRYGIGLIPRRYFGWILSGSESTVDGLHLSNYGHEKMAEAVLRFLRLE